MAKASLKLGRKALVAASGALIGEAIRKRAAVRLDQFRSEKARKAAKKAAKHALRAAHKALDALRGRDKRKRKDRL